MKRYPGTIEARGDAYRVILYVEGKRHSFTVKGTRADAEQAARDHHAVLSGLLPAAAPQHLDGLSGCYAARAVGLARVKIGYSKDVGRRLRELQTMCPVPIVCEAVWLGASRRDEAYLHSMLHRHRVQGEWFRYDSRTRAVIARMEAMGQREWPAINTHPGR